jgi:hypothetical protein
LSCMRFIVGRLAIVARTGWIAAFDDLTRHGFG